MVRALPRAWRDAETSARGDVEAGQLTRQRLAEHPLLWRAQTIVMALLAVAIFAQGAVADLAPVALFAVPLALCAIVGVLTAPPPAGSWLSHASLASIYVLVGVGELAFDSRWVLALSGSMFIATLTVVRAGSDRATIAHLAAAGTWLIVPAAVLGATASELVLVGALVIGVWSLAACARYLLVAAEDQGTRLQELLRVDPLTGVGNSFLLTERVESEVEHHARARRPFLVLAMDLVDFTGVNERLGREVADDLLTQTARAVAGLVRPQDTVARPADDELWVVLPGLAPSEGADVVARIRAGLASIETGDPELPMLEVSVGVAAYPRDAGHAQLLLDVAHKRLADSQQEKAPDLVPHGSAPVVTTLPSGSTDAPVRALSRADLAVRPSFWLFTRVAFVVTALVLAVSVLFDGPVRSGDLAVLAAWCVMVSGLLLLLRRPPAAGTRVSDLVVAAAYLATASAFAFIDDDGRVGLVGVLFVGPLIAVRCTTRGAAFRHLVIATVVFSAAGIYLAVVDATSPKLLELAFVTPGTWILGISCLVVLELAEAIGRRLDALVRIDHVTGVGSPRLLDEVLKDALDSVDGDSVSVVAVELTETFENSRQTSELLLRDAAGALRTALGPDDALARRRGHEFVAVLPHADDLRAEQAATAFFTALRDFARDGHHIEYVYAVATAPRDAGTPEGLLRVLDRRLALAGPSTELHPV